MTARIGLTIYRNSLVSAISPPIVDELSLLSRLVPLLLFSAIADFFDVLDISDISDIFAIIFFEDITSTDVRGVGLGVVPL